MYVFHFLDLVRFFQEAIFTSQVNMLNAIRHALGIVSTIQ